MNKQRGYTLAEILLALFFLALIVAAVAIVLGLIRFLWVVV